MILDFFTARKTVIKWIARSLLSAALALTGFSCAHSKFLDSERPRESRSPLLVDIALLAPGQVSLPEEVPAGTRIRREIQLAGVKLSETEFDYPVQINSRVEHWVEYFTGRGRSTFERWLVRSEYFIPYIQPILRENGLPEDLVYLAMIESGFNNYARSHAKAVGPWQFIERTGLRYGLKIDWWIDERQDIQKSTVAAVAYLKRLYEIFGSWELASAGYNAGENKILQAVKRYGTTDFWTLSDQRFLQSETRNYVPKIIAAAIVSKNRKAYGFQESYREDEAMQLAARGMNYVQSQGDTEAGPGEEALPSSYSPEEIEEDTAESPLALPENFVGPTLPEDTLSVEEQHVMVVENEAAIEGDGFIPVARDSQPIALPLVPHVTRKGELLGENVMEFEVKSPADLAKIAQAAGVSYDLVKALNPEVRRWCTPPNQSTYRIKLPSEVKAAFFQNYNHVNFKRQVDFQVYPVREGDTLSKIARRYGLNYEPFRDLNGISPHTPLSVGRKILLPLPNDNRSWHSLGITDRSRRKGGARRNRNSGTRSAYESNTRPSIANLSYE